MWPTPQSTHCRALASRTSLPLRGELSMQRISIVGTSGSGKTTFARDLSIILQIPHIEMDALHWKANWTPCQKEEFRQRVTTAAAADAWTVCGNYAAIRQIV